jgi:hypothetical protein
LQPGKFLIRLVESGFSQDRVETAFVKAHDNPIPLNFDCAARLHEFAKELFRRGRFKAAQLLGQPALTTVGQNGQRRIQINVETHFAGQTIEMKEVDAAAESVFNTIASGVTDNQRPRTFFDVV